MTLCIACDTRRAVVFLVALAMIPAACSDDSAKVTDLGVSHDVAVADSVGIFDHATLDTAADRGTSDASFDQSAGDAASGDDWSSGLPASCSGACAKQTLTVSFGSVTVPIERAVYGLDRDAKGQRGVYIEALHGGFSGCPKNDSPTTDRTLILSGLPLPEAGKPITEADGLVISLFDYKGDLLGSKPITKATAASVTFVAAKVCPSCVGKPEPSDPKGFVALDLDVTFVEGSVKGRLYAVHCDSLDL
ncbi:MAG: hypothetical protein KAI47_22220 [Deltaproteobacteria bacterium]|nr:hypothetical protein [Deltaproteobacteria bacterium]